MEGQTVRGIRSGTAVRFHARPWFEGLKVQPFHGAR